MRAHGYPAQDYRTHRMCLASPDGMPSFPGLPAGFENSRIAAATFYPIVNYHRHSFLGLSPFFACSSPY